MSLEDRFYCTYRSRNLILRLRNLFANFEWDYDVVESGHPVFFMMVCFGFIKCCMFHDHLSAHSLLAKLGRWVWLIFLRMRLAQKKSQKTLDRSNILHQNTTEAPGMQAKDWIHNFCHYWDCGLGKVQIRHIWRHLVGDDIPARWHLQPGL